MSAITLRELEPAEMVQLYPLVKLLNPELSRREFDRRLKEMRALDYRAVGAFDGKKLVGCSGYWIGVRFWIGRQLDIDNFIIHPAYRAKGVGKKLLAWFEAKAKKERCDALVLDAYSTNTKAHRFYYNAGFGITGYHFTKIPGKHEAFAPKQVH